MLKVLSLLFVVWIIYLIAKALNPPRTIHINELIFSEKERLIRDNARDGLHYVFVVPKLDGTPDYRYRQVRVNIIGLNQIYR
jgi:hypothetical protein